jgi:hypothetical protein
MVQRMVNGCSTNGLEYELRKDQKFSELNVAQTGSGTHPDSYPLGIADSFTGVK